MIKRAAKLPILIMATGLMVGCASQSDFDKLQSEVNAMKSDLASTKRTAQEAADASAAALSAAESAQLSANAANERLDRMFKKSMLK